MNRAMVLIVVALALSVAACGGGGSDEFRGEPTKAPAGKGARLGDLTLVGPFARPVNDTTAEFYFTVENSGKADKLLSVSTKFAARTELRETTEDGSAVRVLDFPVPADGELVLEPGAHHVFMTGLFRPLTQDMIVEVNLSFEDAGRVTVTAAIQRQSGATATPEDD